MKSGYKLAQWFQRRTRQNTHRQLGPAISPGSLVVEVHGHISTLQTEMTTVKTCLLLRTT